MGPIRLSYIWYRRLFATLFVASFGYVTLFTLQALKIVPVTESIEVSVIAAIGAGALVIANVILWVIAKKISSFIPAFAVFLFFTIVTAYLIQTTGGVYSPFLPVWVMAAFIAPAFGALGWLPIFAIAGAYLAGEYLSGSLDTTSSIILLLSSLIPLLSGVILWRNAPNSEEASHANVKNLANQLSEVAAKSEIVINAIGDGVIAVDGKGVIQLINPAAQEILGWGKQDALMLSYKSILKLTDENNGELEPSQDPIEQVLNTNQQARGNKLSAITKSGKKLGVSLVVSPIGDVGSGAIAVFRDITKERAEEREQAEFISTASHEMRTPVAAIEGYLGLALNPNTAAIDDKARDFITKAHESAQHLGRLFQDLLDVSKSEDGRMQSVPKVVDIVPFTESIVEGLNQKAIEKGLQLIFVPTASSGGSKKIMPVYHVNLDNDHVREVLDNLIENAIKYTPQGSVSVDVNGTEDKVIISVKDTGLGIPGEDIPHLFQKFYRVNNMDRQEIGGTGLGLYLSRRLIESMQGRLWVESVFGQGSTFFVELPRVESQEAQVIKEQQAQQLVMQPQAMAPAPAAPLAPAASATPAATTQLAPAQPAPTTQPAQPLQQPQPPAVAPNQAVAPAPTPNVAPQPARLENQAAPPSGARPATTVPRGESLTREQIAERVKQLEQLAQQERASGQGR